MKKIVKYFLSYPLQNTANSGKKWYKLNLPQTTMNVLQVKHITYVTSQNLKFTF